MTVNFNIIHQAKAFMLRNHGVSSFLTFHHFYAFFQILISPPLLHDIQLEQEKCGINVVFFYFKECRYEDQLKILNSKIKPIKYDENFTILWFLLYILIVLNMVTHKTRDFLSLASLSTYMYFFLKTFIFFDSFKDRVSYETFDSW